MDRSLTIAEVKDLIQKTLYDKYPDADNISLHVSRDQVDINVRY